MHGEIRENKDDSATRVDPQYRIRLSLIGNFRAETPDGQSVLPVSRKARALLCVVGMARPQGALRAVAGALLWSGKHREAVANSLRQALGELQPLLGTCGRPYILAMKRGRLVLDPESVWIDVLDMTPEQATAIDPTDPANKLCVDLRGISPTLDAYLDRLWVEIGYRRALTAPTAGRGSWRDQPHSVSSNAALGRLSMEPARLFGNPLASGFSLERLDRFPQTVSDTADLAAHQLGWRMAVLPFRSLGASLGRGIALGMAEEVSAALSRFRAPRLVSTATFWDGNGPAADSMSRCRAYNLDYIIDGTIQVVENRVRVTVTLLDVILNFEVIWSQRFDGTMDDLFSLQDRIAAETVAQVDPELHQRRWATVSQAKTGVPEAHVALLNAISGIYRLDRPRFSRAREHLTRAIELDPDFSAAHAWLAYWGHLAVGLGWVSDPESIAKLSGQSADRAILLDSGDARALAIAGHIKAYFQHDVKAALALHARAVELNPNLPIAWTMSALSKMYSGDHTTSIRHAHTSQSLSPRDPHIFLVEQVLAFANLLAKNLDTAAAWAESTLERLPEHKSALRIALGIFGHLGRMEECAHYLERLRRVDPSASVQGIIAIPPLQPVDLDYYAAGLRSSGVPETAET